MYLDMMPVAFCVHFLYLKDSETLIMVSWASFLLHFVNIRPWLILMFYLIFALYIKYLDIDSLLFKKATNLLTFYFGVMHILP